MGNRTVRNTNRLPVPAFHDIPETTSNTTTTNINTTTTTTRNTTTSDTAVSKQPPMQPRRNFNFNSRPPKNPSATRAQQHATTAKTTTTTITTTSIKRQAKPKSNTPAFRQKVSSANKTAICTTTSHKVGRRTLRQLMHPASEQSATTTNTNRNTNRNTNTTDASVHEAYIVPIFQRRYCWTTQQWETLWHDVLKRHSIRHSLGRLTCTNVQIKTKPNHDHDEGQCIDRSVIIDGQQRFTTVTLILAAIRDSLVSLGEIHSKDNSDLLQSIHEMLFLNPRAMEEWVAGNNNSNTTTATTTNNSNSDNNINNNNTAISEGMTLEFCRLVPTFCDRSAYLAAILPPSAPQVQTFLAETYNPRWHRPLLAKRHFANKIRSLLDSSSQSSPYEILKRLTGSLLDGIDMLYFPIDVDRGHDDGTEDTQVIYERLAIRDATFCKPSRTSEYHSMDGIDMIRNLLLGTFGTSKQMTDFYETLWLPLERMFQTTGTEFGSGSGSGSGSGDHTTINDEENLEALFRAFLEDQTHGVSTSAATATGSMVIGGRIYRDFENWMARDLERWNIESAARRDIDVDGDDNSDDSSSLLSSLVEDHTRDVGTRLLGFATRQGPAPAL